MARKKSKPNARNGNILFAAEEQTNKTPGNQTENQAVQSKPKSWWSDLGRGERVAAIAVCLLLVVGALGSGLGSRIVSTFSAGDANQKAGQTAQPAENSSMLAKLNPFAAAVTTTATPQLSKEYIYAGSRMLAVEDANASVSSTPTPTPTPAPPTQSEYNAVIDFTPDSNSATNVWSYGYISLNTPTIFTLYTGNGQHWDNKVKTWSSEPGGTGWLMVAKNVIPGGGMAYYAGVIEQPADLLNLHPGPNGEQSVVRWKAPAAGKYLLTGRFEGIDRGGTSSNVRILLNDGLVWEGTANNNTYGFGAKAEFNFKLTVLKDAEIDFVVGYGNATNGNTYNSDSTGLKAIIKPPPDATPTPTPTPIPPATALTYDAVEEFRTPESPANTWSYGYQSTVYEFSSYTGYGPQWNNVINAWSVNTGGGGYPMVAKTINGNQTYANGAITQPADLLNLHPGATGEKSTVRWTAPATGTYRIHGHFQGIDNSGTTTDVSILHRSGAAVSTVMASSAITAFGEQKTFNYLREIQVGDMIDFIVGYGSYGTYYSDSTGLKAIITTNLYGANTPNFFRLDTTTRKSWLDGFGEQAIAKAGERTNLPAWATEKTGGE